MALSLAMNLSGVERQYFYDAGAKDMYDAGEKLMKTLTLTKSQESNNNNPTAMVNLHCKDNTTTNSSTSMAVPIINTNMNKNNVALSSPHSVSPSSTSSGFISEESEVIGPTTQAPIFNIRVPPPNSFVRHPITVQQSIEYSPPEYGGNTNTNIMTNYNIATSIAQKQQQSRFPPIGTKRSGSPIRTTVTSSQQSNNNNTTSPSSTITTQQCTSHSNNDKQQTNELFGANTIWSYSTIKSMAATQPKNQIIYGKRDILDLAGNIKDVKWQFCPAQLPIGNTRMFFENRSQYHRLATFEQNDDNFEECLVCKFFLPTY
ncbi:putative uncharacterized protein DDB_G0285119 [Chrysoperla carnea]|uniref:putative uncharacterized protein DDB_G0285119 n=1 Tax=Chrysoperla carnea TaxID=189513 RepID=UPI001D090C1A|nr:putative uncharacterized protein DDB_G0285119 [Chrysoperla carnea]